MLGTTHKGRQLIFRHMEFFWLCDIFFHLSCHCHSRHMKCQIPWTSNRFIFCFNPLKYWIWKTESGVWILSRIAGLLSLYLVKMQKVKGKQSREHGEGVLKLVVKDLNSNVKIFSLVPSPLFHPHTQTHTQTHRHTHTQKDTNPKTRTHSHKHTLYLSPSPRNTHTHTYPVHLYSERCSSERVVGM